MSTENTSSKIDQLTNNVFSVLLILLFIGSIISFFISVFTKAYATSGFSATGAAGSAMLYMKWDVIRRTRIKESSVSEVGDLLNKTTSNND